MQPKVLFVVLHNNNTRRLVDLRDLFALRAVSRDFQVLVESVFIDLRLAIIYKAFQDFNGDLRILINMVLENELAIPNDMSKEELYKRLCVLQHQPIVYQLILNDWAPVPADLAIGIVCSTAIERPHFWWFLDLFGIRFTTFFQKPLVCAHAGLVIDVVKHAYMYPGVKNPHFLAGLFLGSLGFGRLKPDIFETRKDLGHFPLESNVFNIHAQAFEHMQLITTFEELRDLKLGISFGSTRGWDEGRPRLIPKPQDYWFADHLQAPRPGTKTLTSEESDKLLKLWSEDFEKIKLVRVSSKHVEDRSVRRIKACSEETLIEAMDKVKMSN